MKKNVPSSIIWIVLLIIASALNSNLIGQEAQTAPKLFIGGGALPEEMYPEFLKLTGPDAILVVIPNASGDEIIEEDIIEEWHSRGFKNVSVLFTRDRAVASSEGFSDPLKKATSVWFSGGSQQRIADAYIGTPVEEELYRLLKRGGVIGGSSAGAAIQSRIMIRGGGTEPKISTGLDLLPGAIIDQHFLRRNRFSRLLNAIRTHPDMVGYAIDEGTALVVSDNTYKVVGKSYLLRVELVDGVIRIDAYEDGDTIPPEDHLAGSAH